MSIIKCIKDKTFKTLSKIIIEKSDKIKICEDLEYPDLINILVKTENVNYFSEICSEYLECSSYLKDTSIILMKQLLDGYIVESDKDLRHKELNQLIESILNDAVLIKRLAIGNIIKRDSEYRNMIRKHIKDIESVDVNIMISLLVKLNASNLI